MDNNAKANAADGQQKTEAPPATEPTKPAAGLQDTEKLVRYAKAQSGWEENESIADSAISRSFSAFKRTHLMGPLTAQPRAQMMA